MRVRKGRPAVFVDRDGTLIRDRHYLSDPDGVELLPGAAAAVRRLRDAGFAVVCVTNQSGIARGLLTWDDFRATQARLDELLAAEGAGLDGVYVCPHHPEVTGPCDCRKPAPGLFLRAARELGLDLSASYYVGDRWRDVAAAERWGGTPILVASGPDAETGGAAATRAAHAAGDPGGDAAEPRGSAGTDVERAPRLRVAADLADATRMILADATARREAER